MRTKTQTNAKLKGLILERFRFQGDFAQKARISETRLSRLIRGRARSTGQERKRFARLLNTPIEELWEGDFIR